MLNNDDNSFKIVWSLQNPSLEEGWIIGRAQIVPDGEKEYQVRCVFISAAARVNAYFVFFTLGYRYHVLLSPLDSICCWTEE